MEVPAGSTPFHSVEEETAQAHNNAYQLAFEDPQFLMLEELRPVRLQLEYLKPEIEQREHHIESTVVIFGSARTPSPEHALSGLMQVEKELKADPTNSILMEKLRRAKAGLEQSKNYEQARKLTFLISTHSQTESQRHFVVVTGGGPGIMEAANRGAHDARGISIGLNILLPREQNSNPYITPELNFRFHYFALRKMHFLIRARAAAFFPGGFGTLDELFETLTLMQTKKISRFPIVLFNKSYWDNLVNFEFMIEQGMIDEDDLNLFSYAETAEEAWAIIGNSQVRIS